MLEMLKFLVAPFLSPAIGALITIRLKPSEWVRSVLQHAAAGLVFAAATVEMLPVVLREKQPLPTAVGFIIAVSFLLVVRWRFRAKPDKKEATSPKTVIPLATAVGLDAAVDGLLVGLGFAIGEAEGKLLAFAMTLENMFVGIALASSSQEKNMKKTVTFFLTATAGVFFLIAAIAGFLIASSLQGFILTAVVAFGIAAIFYLVTEELLIKVHKNPDTAIETSSFFVGYLTILVLTML